MTNKPNQSLPVSSAPIWKNWSGNLVHQPASDGVNYYHAPKNLDELKKVLTIVKNDKGATIRVSGQRHSQPPLVADDNRSEIPKTTKEYLVDMSCYADLGPGKDQRIIPGPKKTQVIINAGVREDELDAYLTAHNLMMKTVTAGGFFSIGGMTAVDVHGATIDSPIFAGHVSEFNILLADGSTVKKINEKTTGIPGWSALQFARVSLGGLGIVTSLLLNVMERPYATTLQGGIESHGLRNKPEFVKEFKKILSAHQRVETFFTPYATDYPPFPNFEILWWNIVNDPTQKNEPTNPPNACELASENPPLYGAPFLSGIAQYGADIAQKSQYSKSPGNSISGAFEDGIYNPAIITAAGLEEIKNQGAAANKAHSEMWLDGAVAVIFMSYFIPLPNLDDEGLGKVWDSLDVVSKIVLQDNKFHIAAPMEFRFVKGGDSAMSGAYSESSDTWFVNQDLIGFVEPNLKASEYPAKLLQFFADVERQWAAMGGFPHNGKMYGFYDPSDAPGTYSKSGPFNPNFLTDLRKRRGERLEAYAQYRDSLDPDGLFKNKYLRQLLGS